MLIDDARIGSASVERHRRRQQVERHKPQTAAQRLRTPSIAALRSDSLAVSAARCQGHGAHRHPRHADGQLHHRKA